MGLMVLLLALGSSSHASAANFNWYWYNGGVENCWQTGQFGAESAGCDNTGALFLTVPGRAFNDTEGGISKDFLLKPAGDYCSYYGTGGTLNLKDPSAISGFTGYSPPSPLENYQESNELNGSETACQADGGTFGFQVTDHNAGNNCHRTCGMHHYASFTGQGEEGRPWNLPWSGVFGSPSLVISANAGVVTFNASGSSYGGWAYVCPELKDTTTGGILEYCLQEWRSTNNISWWKDERIGECNSPFSMINTFFYPGTQFVTQVGGADTYEGTLFGLSHFEAKITKTNLENAIKLVNSSNNGEGGHPKPGVGCGWGLSTNPENYALIGVEQGMEGWDGIEKLAGSVANLQLHTEYTPLAPEASTTGASSLQPSQATLNGSVNPKGTSTSYYFEYGTTTSYGSSTSHQSAGSGQGSVGESATVGLSPGTTYHYRIVATSEGGTVTGKDSEFTTPSQPEAITGSPSSIQESSVTLNGEVNPKGYDGYSATWHFEYGPTTSYGTSTPETGAGSGTTLTSVKAIIGPLHPGTTYHYRLVASNAWGVSYGTDHTVQTTASPEVFFNDATKEKTISFWAWNPTEGWRSSFLGHDHVAAGTSPAVAWNPATAGTGAPETFFVDASKENTIAYWSWNATEGWHLISLGHDKVATGTSPAVVWNPNGSGTPEVFFDDASKENTISYWSWNATEGWHLISLGSDKVATGTSPTIVWNPTGTGSPEVFFDDASKENTISYWSWNATQGWHVISLGQDKVVSGTSPTAIWNPSGTPEVFFDDATKGEVIDYWSWNPSEGWHLLPLKEGSNSPDKVAAGTSPDVIWNPSGTPEVFFSDATKEATVAYWSWNATEGWHVSRLKGDKVASGTSPSAVWNPTGRGTPEVFYNDATKKDTLSYWSWNPTEGWHASYLSGDTVTEKTSPAAIMR